MEEKERYKLESPNGTFSHIHDTELDEWFLNRQPITELLNKQDKQIKALEEKNKVDDFWHSAYQGKQLEYDQVYAELRKEYEENQQLKQTLENLQKLNGETIILNRTVTKDSQILEKEIEQLKQSQKQLAIGELEKVKERFGYKHNTQLVVSSRYLCEFIDNQIKDLKENKNGRTIRL